MPSNLRLSTRSRSRRGPMALYLDGRRSCHTPPGSMMWSSTLTNLGMTRSVPVVVGSGAVIVTVVSCLLGCPHHGPPRERVKGGPTPRWRHGIEKPDDPSGFAVGSDPGTDGASGGDVRSPAD